MNRRKGFVPFVMFLPLLVSGCGQNREKNQPGSAQKEPRREVRVAQGLVVQQLSATSVSVKWSTNVVTDGLLRYGTSADHLDQVVAETWGGLTHRVTLTDLKPNTTYYCRVATPSSQRREPMNAAVTFQTKSESQAKPEKRTR